MMHQSRRREHGHGSSGELDVFRATTYFAGLPPPALDDGDRASSVTEPSSADRLRLHFQAKVVQRDTTTRMETEDKSFRRPHHHQQQLGGLHDHAAERHASSTQLQLQVVAAKRQQPSGKSKLAALLSFMVSVSPSPSPRNSFRKEKKQEAPSSSTRLRQAEAAAGAGAGERGPADTYYKKAVSPSSSSRLSSSMQLQGLFGAHDGDDDDEVDLGVATGDRRLQGVTVVRGIIGGEERWVVRCVRPGGAWDDEEHRDREKMVHSAESASSEHNIKDELVEVEQLKGDDDGNIDPAHSWDSDSSSDLFDLDLEYI